MVRAFLICWLQKNEKVRQMYNKVKAACSKWGQHQGLTRIEIPLHPDDDPKSCAVQIGDLLTSSQ